MSKEIPCYRCGSDDETRPYGPGRQPVCFKCATATPEDEAVAAACCQELMAPLLHCSGVLVVGKECGPVAITGASGRPYH